MNKNIEEKIKKEIRYYSAQATIIQEENENLNQVVDHNVALFNRIAADLDESNIMIELLRKMMNNGK